MWLGFWPLLLWQYNAVIERDTLLSRFEQSCNDFIAKGDFPVVFEEYIMYLHPIGMGGVSCQCYVCTCFLINQEGVLIVRTHSLSINLTSLYSKFVYYRLYGISDKWNISLLIGFCWLLLVISTQVILLFLASIVLKYSFFPISNEFVSTLLFIYTNKWQVIECTPTCKYIWHIVFGI